MSFDNLKRMYQQKIAERERRNKQVTQEEEKRQHHPSEEEIQRKKIKQELSPMVSSVLGRFLETIRNIPNLQQYDGEITFDGECWMVGYEYYPGYAGEDSGSSSRICIGVGFDDQNHAKVFSVSRKLVTGGKEVFTPNKPSGYNVEAAIRGL